MPSLKLQPKTACHVAGSLWCRTRKQLADERDAAAARVAQLDRQIAGGEAEVMEVIRDAHPGKIPPKGATVRVLSSGVVEVVWTEAAPKPRLGDELKRARKKLKKKLAEVSASAAPLTPTPASPAPETPTTSTPEAPPASAPVAPEGAAPSLH